MATRTPAQQTAIQATPTTPTPSRAVRLRYLSGSSVKVEQLIGDFDNQTKKPTQNQTGARYGVFGTDLGNSFEHNGKVYFLFGDMPAPFAPDPIAFSESTNPDAPLILDFITDAQGRYLRILPPGISMGPFNVNDAGLSLDGVMYLVVKTDHSDSPTDRSVLTRFDEQARSFVVLRDISRLPAGHFIKMTLRHVPEGLAGLPIPGPQVLMFGTGEGSKSSAYLAAIPAPSFATGEGTRYFAGMSGSAPRWSEKEGDAAPIVDHPTMADISVIHVKQIDLWLMIYSSREPGGVVLRYAARPWGQWSDPQVIFNATRDKAIGSFIHNPNQQPEDGLEGPLASAANDPKKTPGAAYAAYMIERFTRVEGDKLHIHYLLSTWNPYVVVRIRSTLSIER